MNAIPMIRRWSRSSLVFSGVATVALVALLWGIRSAMEEAHNARRKLAFMQRELKVLRGVSPALTPEVAELMESEKAALREMLSALQAELGDEEAELRQSRAMKIPANRTEAFFTLAEFVEERRSRAQVMGVRIKPDERFGFAGYAQSGPETATIPHVIAQCSMVEYLLEALFAARPEELLAVQRQSHKSPRLASISDGRQAPDDFFVMEPAWSMGLPEVAEATGYRLVFTGQTAVLRTFLNRLADSELPVSVRVVEVEPLPKSRQSMPVQTAPAGVMLVGQAAGEPAAPLIERTSSRFTVMVEHLQLVVPAPPAA